MLLEEHRAWTDHWPTSVMLLHVRCGVCLALSNTPYGWDDTRVPYRINDVNGKKSLELFQPWEEGYHEVFVQNGVTHLRVRGEKIDLSFLSTLPGLKSLRVEFPSGNLEAIEASKQLEELSFGSKLSSRLDVSGLEALRVLGVIWSDRVHGIANLQCLEEVGMVGASESALDDLVGMPSIRSLRLFKPKSKDLKPVSLLVGLRKLRVACLSTLSDCSFLKDLLLLKELSIDECTGFRDISLLSRLENLTHLYLADVGEVLSLAPVARLPKIRKVAVFGGRGTRVKDTDFSCLLENPSFEELDVIGRGGCVWRRNAMPWTG